MSRFIDLTGHRFGRLVVIAVNPNRSTQRKARWDCVCDCGNKKTIAGGDLRSGKTQSCGCLSKEIHFQKNSLAKHEAAKNNLFGMYKRSARFNGREFSLTREQFFSLTKQRCFYCGVGPSRILKWRHPTGDYIYNGLDRVDNTKGYTIDNVVPCCNFCNLKKRETSQSDFLNWIRRVYRYCKHPASVPLIPYE